jgi:RNase H-fold protein (predicted Holliday junction resolvase)
VDETLSSHSVHEKLLNRKKANGSRARGARAPIDHLAAAEFLQEYLDFSQS